MAGVELAPASAASAPKAIYRQAIGCGFKGGWHGSEAQLLSIGFDAGHALAIKRAPSTLTFLAGNGEITTTDDRRVLQRMARPFDFLSVARVELKLALVTIELGELHRDDRTACVADEIADGLSFVHGKEGEVVGSRPVMSILEHDGPFVKPLND